MNVVLVHLFSQNCSVVQGIENMWNNFRALIACKIALFLSFCRFFRLSLKNFTQKLTLIKTILMLLSWETAP